MLEQMSVPASRTRDLAITLVAAQGVVTFAHHLYGGLTFDSPGRTIMAFVFAAILGGTLWLHRLGATVRWARRACHTLVVAFWVVLLGLYEGGYNHTLYLILREVDPARAQSWYPAGSDAVISNDVFFQGTGVLTLTAGIAVAIALLAARRRRAGTERSSR
jgi:hypothetical protein